MKRRRAKAGRPLDNGPVAQTTHCAMGTVIYVVGGQDAAKNYDTNFALDVAGP